MHKRMY